MSRHTDHSHQHWQHLQPHPAVCSSWGQRSLSGNIYTQIQVGIFQQKALVCWAAAPGSWSPHLLPPGHTSSQSHSPTPAAGTDPHHTHTLRAVGDFPGPNSPLSVLLPLETCSHSLPRGGPQRSPNPSLPQAHSSVLSLPAITPTLTPGAAPQPTSSTPIHTGNKEPLTGKELRMELLKTVLVRSRAQHNQTTLHPFITLFHTC